MKKSGFLMTNVITVKKSVKKCIWNEKRDNKQCLLDTPCRITVNNKRLISKHNQRTSGPVNAHLMSWPSKVQNIQNLEIYGKEMTLMLHTKFPGIRPAGFGDF